MAAPPIAPPPGFELDTPELPSPPEGFTLDSATPAAADEYPASASRAPGFYPGREGEGGLYISRGDNLPGVRRPASSPYTAGSIASVIGPLLKPLAPLTPFSLGDQLKFMAGSELVGPGLATKPIPALEVPAGIVKGIENVATGAGQFMTSPLGFATLGLGAAPGSVKALASGTFAADMASHAPDAWQRYWEAAYAGDKSGQAEALTEGLGTLAMAGLAGSHGYREARAALEPLGSKAGKMFAAQVEATPELPPADLRPGAQVEVAPPKPPSGFVLDVRVPLSAGEGPPVRGVTRAGLQAPPPEIESKSAEPLIPSGEPSQPLIRPAPAISEPVPAPAEGRAVPEAAPESTQSVLPTTQFPPVQVPVSQIATRPDLMQFKKMLDTGTGKSEQHAETIGGPYDELKGGLLLLWEPRAPTAYGLAPGQRYIVANGHGRFEAFKGQTPVFNAQILREADGISANEARMTAALVNIADGKGTIYDQTKFLRNLASTLGPDAALARARQEGVENRRAAGIAFSATEPTFDLFINERITPAQAEAIARAAPGNDVAQQLGAKLALADKPLDFIRARLERERAAAETATQTDLFGNAIFDASKADAEAERVADIRRQLREDISAVSGAARKPEIARRYGIQTPDDLRAKLNALRAEQEAWEGSWWLRPELVARVKGEPLTLAPPESVAEQAARLDAEARANVERAARLAAEERAATAQREMLERAGKPLGGDLGSAGQGALSAEPGQQEMFRPPPAEGGINTGALGEVGMGGAKPGEFAPGPGAPTSIKNALVDQERIARGLPPAMQVMRRSFGVVWDEAMANVDRAPEAQDALIAELRTKPRSVTDFEDALLLHRQIDLQNEYARHARELAAAYDDSKRFPDRLEAVERHKLLLNETSNRLQEIYDIGKAVGTETARGLAARKMLANEDFTLAKMEMEMRAAKDGRPLSDAERQELQRAHDRIAELQRKHDEAVARADAAESARAAEAAVRQLQAQAAAAEPVFTPEVSSLAERIVARLETEAVAARARLREKFARTSAGVDPTILYDLSVIGAAKIARGILNKAQFIASLIEEFGEGVRAYEDAAWDAANAKIDREVGRMAGAKAPEVRNAVRRADPTAQRQNIIERMGETVREGSPLQELGELVRKLALNFVRAGISTRDALIDAVHAELLKILPDVTRRQAMDAISGYGDFRPLDPNQFKAKLRDLKGQMQQVAKLEDIQARQPPLKTGVERRAPSDEERRLIAQVNEAKRRYGVVATDPARQLAGALDTIKTRLRNQISDLEHQISTRQRIVKERTKTPYDAEAELLKSRRDALKTQFETIFPSPGISDAQRLLMAERAIERDIGEYEKRIAAGDIGPLRGRERQLRGAKLDALRARRDALRDELESLRAAAKADPAAQLADLKARMSARLADYMDRNARGDFAVRTRPTVHLDNAALRIRAELEIAKGHWRRGVELAALRNRSLPHRLLGGVREALNLPRAVLASWDLSAVLRQGGFIALGHPLRAARSLGPMFRALGSERQAFMVEQQIASRPNAPLYHRAKLYLAPLETTRLTSMEEAFMSRLAARVPGVAWSQRAFVTFLNKLRADSFDALVDGMQGRGAELNQAELQAVANYINIATGRGDLGRAAAAAETLATAFFAPRLVASRFQLLAGKPFYDGSARTRRAVAMEYARFLAGLAVLYGLANLAGANLEHDPRSTDFGKLRFGNTRVDPLAGLNQVSVLTSRLVTGERLTSEREVRPIRGAVPYGQDTSADVIARFLRSKLSPVVGASVDVLSGQNVVGQPATPGGTAVRLLAPLSFQDIYAVMQADGVPKAAALGVLSVFGMGLQQQEDPATRKAAAEVMRKIRGGTPEQREEIRRQLQQNLKGR